MVDVYCDNENCNNEKMESIGSDNRQEWHEEYFECHVCGSKKIHRIEFDQNGLVIKDEIITLDEEE